MKLHHPRSGQQIDVSAGQARMYESQGWVRTPVVKKEKPVKAGPNEKEKANGN